MYPILKRFKIQIRTFFPNAWVSSGVIISEVHPKLND